MAVLFALSLTLVSCRKDSDGDGTVTTVSLSARETTLPKEKGSTFLYVKASGKWTLTLEYADEATGGWAYVQPASGEGAFTSNFGVQANTGEEARKVRVVLTAGDKTASVEITQAGTSGGGGGGGEGSSAGGWLELPETPEGRWKLLAHDMEGNPYVSNTTSGVRNWSCWWDPEEHLSIWVAYPLNNSLKGSGSRTNAWENWRDPCLAYENYASQPNTSSTYGGGWTRGHQIPSADRLKTAVVNASTFYSTNMTPQQYDFNKGIWASLENYVRTYAGKSDTLYVVTGCDISTNVGMSLSNTGFRVKAPGAYWKAVVSYQKSRTVYGGFLGCAFYLPHDASIADGNCLDYMMSIDQLEQKIGIDLFVNLPAKIGDEDADKLEAAAPGSFWK